MLAISEITPIIDALEERLEAYSDKTMWKTSANQSDWQTWILTEGPKIVQSWRELASLISLTPGDQLIELQNKWESIQGLMQNSEVLAIALKYQRKQGPAAHE
jgi:hypothetical protein